MKFTQILPNEAELKKTAVKNISQESCSVLLTTLSNPKLNNKKKTFDDTFICRLKLNSTL